MTNENIIQTLDNVGVALMNIEVKGKHCFEMSEALKALNAIRREMEKRCKAESEQQNKEESEVDDS